MLDTILSAPAVAGKCRGALPPVTAPLFWHRLLALEPALRDLDRAARETAVPNGELPAVFRRFTQDFDRLCQQSESLADLDIRALGRNRILRALKTPPGTDHNLGRQPRSARRNRK